MYNKLVVIGNLTKEGDNKILPSGSEMYANTIATTHKFKKQDGTTQEEVSFINFTAFGGIAKVCNSYLKKGSKVLLEGRLAPNNYQGQDGKMNYGFVLRVDEMKMLDSKNTNQQSQQQAQYQQPQQPQQPQNIPEIEYDLDEDGNEIIPF